MLVREIAQKLDLKVVAGTAVLDRQITGGYSADLLSCVLARAKAGNVWATLQAHPNVIAVATLLELTAVVVTEGADIPGEVSAKAEAEGIVLLSTPHTSFWLAGELARLGVKAQE
jgi:serine kinase of HPr protein (carbohydrate metabolism regulator)